MPGLRPVLQDPRLRREDLAAFAAQATERIRLDDSIMKVLERPGFLMRGKKERKGIYTTGLIAKSGANRVALFITGMRHAGENLADLLKQRIAGLVKPIQVCDTLAANKAGVLDTVVAHRLAHARLKFVDVVTHVPEEGRTCLETLKPVHPNDAATAAMSPLERLAHHQEQSGPGWATSA